MEDFQGKYPEIKFQPKSELELKAYSHLDGVKDLPDKIIRTFRSKFAEVQDQEHQDTPSITALKRMISSKAQLAGSKALGINIDNSDVDFFVPYKSKATYRNAIQRMREKFPDFVESKANALRDDKFTLSGVRGDQDIDIVLGQGQRAVRFSEAFTQAKNSLTEAERAAIRSKKRTLKDAWLFPKVRYQRYKNRVADDLGLKQHYF